jgi:hypothetical protein
MFVEMPRTRIAVAGTAEAICLVECAVCLSLACFVVL